ncbi:hypothetical protein [Marinomonas transparens]|uniref:Uncharacterized protein n=1 Tax=Marinomonas transparens TaxID=2795388 RepID=A0A934N5F6_9GAMM|nr:hypothetical protein [Marinomonas transparens]MBJ7536996.1 hypothetical protein [Marinomonas transparens]
MNEQQPETLISRVKAMQSEYHTLLFAWFSPTKDFHFSGVSVEDEINKIWRKFRAYCKRNNIQLQGIRRIKTTRKHKAKVFELALFVPNASLDAVKNQLSDAFPKSDFKTTVMPPITEERGIQYIENIMLYPDQPNAYLSLISATPNPLATQTQQ